MNNTRFRLICPRTRHGVSSIGAGPHSPATLPRTTGSKVRLALVIDRSTCAHLGVEGRPGRCRRRRSAGRMFVRERGRGQRLLAEQEHRRRRPQSRERGLRGPLRRPQRRRRRDGRGQRQGRRIPSDRRALRGQDGDQERAREDRRAQHRTAGRPADPGHRADRDDPRGQRRAGAGLSERRLPRVQEAVVGHDRRGDPHRAQRGDARRRQARSDPDQRITRRPVPEAVEDRAHRRDGRQRHQLEAGSAPRR